MSPPPLIKCLFHHVHAADLMLQIKLRLKNWHFVLKLLLCRRTCDHTDVTALQGQLCWTVELDFQTIN